MTPRPRKVSDEDVLAATLRTMERLGPGELTLAHIAAEAGVTAGALVQRFGSRRQLLLALAAQSADGAGEFVRGLGESEPSPLAALRAYAACLAHLAASPAALARNLAYLQIDLTDDDFRAHLLAQSESTHAALVELVDAGVARGELRADVDADRLARTIATALSGSLITWATYRDGAPADWLRADLDAVLAPYVVESASRRRRGASHPG